MVHAEALLYSTEPWNAFNRVKQLENNTKKAISIAENLNLTEQQLNVWYKRLESLQLIKARIFFTLKVILLLILLMYFYSVMIKFLIFIKCY